MRLVFCFMLLVFFSFAIAQTVPDHVYLQNEIDQKSMALSYDELQMVLEENPMYQVDCVKNGAKETKNDAEDETAFKIYLAKEYGQGLLGFKFLPMRYGFNVLAQKYNSKNQVQAGDVESFRSEVSCGDASVAARPPSQGNAQQNQSQDMDREKTKDENSQTSKASEEKNTAGEGLEKNCGSLMFTHEMQISIDDQDGDYSSIATKEESWQVYYISEKNMLAQISVTFTGESHNWLGNKSGSVTVSRHYICRMTLLEGQ